VCSLTRYKLAWNDAAKQPRRKPIQPAPGAHTPEESKQLLSWQPNRQGWFVPYGGLAQELGGKVGKDGGLVLRAGQGKDAAVGTRPAWGAGAGVNVRPHRMASKK
jgi:hypothetical protein